MQDELAWMSATELVVGYRSGDLRPREVLRSLLARIEEVNPVLNAFVAVDDAGATMTADAAELSYDSGRADLLTGVPVAIKDNTPTEGLKTTWGSMAYNDAVPGKDAPLVRKLRDAGACILGKTNTPELGSTFATDSRLYGPTRNPWNVARSAGGSSGGAAAAVAAGLCPIAHGNDGAGSIRVPASFCGVFGFKPSRGRIATDPADGGINFLHHEGVISRTVGDAALFMSVTAGWDPKDPWSMYRGDLEPIVEPPEESLTLAWSPDFGGNEVDPEVASICEDAVLVLAACVGSEGRVKHASPDLAGLKDAYLPAFRSIGFVGHAGLENDLLKLMCGQVQNGVHRARGLLATDLSAMQRKMAEIAFRIHEFFNSCDILLTPTSSNVAFSVDDPLWDLESDIPDRALDSFLFTPAFNLSGNPAASVPVGIASNGLPVGLQVVGRFGEDTTVLSVARAMERERPWIEDLMRLSDGL